MRRQILQRAMMQAGMTLVELLVVVAIIGVLVALVLPGVQAARESARRTNCQSNLRQLGVAMALHANAHGSFPTGCIGRLREPPNLVPRSISWNVQILPFIERASLAESFVYSLPSSDAANKSVGAVSVQEFLCPSTEQADVRSAKGLWKGCAFTDYAGIYGVEGPSRKRDDANSPQTINDESLGVYLYDEAVSPNSVMDGLSKTAGIAETVDRRETETEWVNGQNIFAQQEESPINFDIDPGGEIGSPHPGGASLVFCDAHVEFVSEAIEQSALNAMLTKAGGE